MKRIIALALVLALAAAGAIGQVKAKDGVYFAQSKTFGSSGWKAQVVVEVKGGKITKAVWNGVSNLPGALDKIGAEWDQQAAATEAYLLKTQDAAFNKFDKDGKTDAISGATMTTKEFYDLLAEALASAPVAKGPFKLDGWFYKEQDAFDKSSGWKDSVLVTVVNGSIVDLLWSGIYKDNSKKSKLVEAVTGRYGMAKVAKKGEWNVQAAAAQDAIMKAGDPAKIALKADGTSDAVSGASIRLTAVALAIEALKAAR
jgi:major membrane immunogen (membrane-anchored lipoprotein)